MAKKGVLHIADLLVKQLGPIAAKEAAKAATPAAPAIESALP